MTDLVVAALLGLVEGLTEFIPVSSTGHLIVAGHLLGFDGPAAGTFEIFIQLGAILAVVLLYRQRFIALLRLDRGEGFVGLNGLLLLGLTTLPALVLGALTHGLIKDRLFHPVTVAAGLAVGGVAMILVERLLRAPQRFTLDDLRWQHALLIGLFQCLSLWPGVSRAGATIVGGLVGGFDRRAAAEYSFLVAVPALFAAAAYDLLQSADLLSLSDVPVFAVGFAVAFLTAWLAIRFFIRLLGVHTLAPFGWYRIVAAAAIYLFFT